VTPSLPQMRSIAQRLITYEAQGEKSSETAEISSFRVTDRLRPQLATLMGHGGFRALLARALALGSAEVRWLGEVQVRADGTLDGLATAHASLEPEEFHEGRVVVLARLLGLLVAFIGPALTLRLIVEIWPQLAADNVDLGDGDKT